jgi:Mce-associated membrane protein
MTNKERAGMPRRRAVTPSEDGESRLMTGSPRRKRWRVNRDVKIFPVILVALTLVSGGVAAAMYFAWYRPDQQTNPGAEQTVIRAASDGTVALLSYSPDSLDKDFASAKSHLSGDFLSYYDQFTQQIVAPAAKQKSLKTTAHVMRAAVSELHPEKAVVLVYVDQNTTSKDSPDPAMAASSVLVSMTRVNGTWLITKFSPV